MEKQRKKQIKTVVTWVCIALVVMTLAVMPLLAEEAVLEDGPQASILSAKAENRTIELKIIGGGQLASSATEDLTIPAEVKLTEYLVGNGDTVSRGDPIARVDKVSVQSALAAVQETLDHLAGEIADAAKSSDEDTVKAHAGGLVKVIYGQPGDSAREVMLEHGALAVLSLDGRMAVDLETDENLKAGSKIPVALADGSEVQGKVESSAAGQLTVSLEDEGYPVGETVTVKTAEGRTLGQGELYIHNAWNAAAYHGVLSRVHVQEGDKVSAGKKLFTLDVGDYSDQFQILSAQRQEYEELMKELFTLYDSGVVTAPCDGLVTGVDKDGAFLLSAADEQGWVIQLLSNEGGDPLPPPEGGDGAVIPPGEGGGDPVIPPEEGGDPVIPPEGGGEDAPAVVDTAVGRVTAADGTSATVSVMGGQEEVWLLDVVYTDATLTAPYPSPIAVGDTIYRLTYSDDSVKYVFGSAAAPAPGQSQMPDFGGMMGSMGSMGGMGTPAPVFEPYPLEKLTIACVTSQEKMTLTITADEQDVHRLSVGQQAAVTVEALPGQSFPAQITSIGNSGSSSGGSSKFTAKLTLGKSGQMIPGMNASAFLTMETLENVLTIPVAALTDENGKTQVYTGYDEKQEVLTNPVEVTTGASDGEYVQILTGLSLGDTIRYAYYDTPEYSNIPENPLGF